MKTVVNFKTAWMTGFKTCQAASFETNFVDKIKQTLSWNPHFIKNLKFFNGSTIAKALHKASPKEIVVSSPHFLLFRCWREVH